VVTTASRVESAFFLGSAMLLAALPIIASVPAHLRRPRRAICHQVTRSD
jgi:hypothetical protein